MIVGVNPSSGPDLPVATLLTANKLTATQAVYTTASISPGANRAVYAFVASVQGAGVVTPTLSGNGLTWTQIAVQSISTLRRLTVFRAMGSSPTAGAVTITHGSNMAECVWSIVEVADVDTTGTHASGATVQVVQKADAIGLTGTNTLAALGSENNVHLAAIMTRSTSHAAVTHDADFAELSDTDASACLLEVAWARNQTAYTPTWAGSDNYVMVSIEVKAL